MASDTLPCGHPVRYEFEATDRPGTGRRSWGCAVCEGEPLSVYWYAAELCGVEFRADEQAWARAIVAEPDSDVPRLVFADWLDDQGDDRGELVRVECELLRHLRHCTSEDPWSEIRDQFTALCERSEQLRRQLGY